MKSIKEADVKDKKVIVRCDFNVSVDDKGRVVDDMRIKEAMPTIEDLIKREAKVILISHFGRPEKKKSFKSEGDFSSLKEVVSPEKRDCSLYPVYLDLKKKISDIDFYRDCVGKRVKRKVAKMSSGSVLLLENLRYYEDEEENGRAFSVALSSLADIYVNNAFSASHRDHASIVGLPNYLPAYTGYLFERELRFLSRIKQRVERPFVVLVGGAKITSKAKTIDFFLTEADKLLIGGKVANKVMSYRGEIDEPLTDKEKEIMKGIDFDSEKINLPVDVVVSKDEGKRDRRTIDVKSVKKGEVFDIGSKTISEYSEIISQAKTILWAGPMGFFEHEKFEEGTKKIGEAVVDSSALKIIGGGDTGFAMKKFGLREKIDHISLGGGAMLNFLSDKEMPGVKALKEKK